MKRYVPALAGLGLWLAAWIGLSWPAIQDDALIHLRYAENLVRFHAITYDGVQPNFGTSSLLYVSLLAMASRVTESPNLPRLISSLAHVCLFGGLAWMFVRKIPSAARLAWLLALLLLALLISPASVRWLDDGMETGLVLCGTCCLAWLAFAESRCRETTPGRFAELLLLGFLLTLLRTELSMLAGMASLAILAGKLQRGGRRDAGEVLRAVLRSSHLALGCLLAFAAILLWMGVLLPDTALAKAEGPGAWRLVLIATRAVLESSFAVGAGMAVFWLLTLLLVVLCRRLDLASAVANAVLPVLLGLSMLRGQDIQGVRYLLWALLFPPVWNILTLASDETREVAEADGRRRTENRLQMGLVYAFAVLLVMELPFESKMMFRVLRTRAETMREFEGQQLQQLTGMRGVSMDIGYIGYFTHAQICDMSGLVNGRAVARMSSVARVERCARESPEFAFGNGDQLAAFAQHLDMSRWRVCSGYDFGNLRTPDTHYLVAPPATADRVCRATGTAPATQGGIETVVHLPDAEAPAMGSR